MAINIRDLAKQQALAKETLAREKPTLPKPDAPKLGVVELVTPGSPAALVGLRSGDQIVEVNGVAVQGDDIPQLILNSKSAIGLTVKRGESLLRLPPTAPHSGNSLGFTLLGGGDTPFAQATTPQSMTSRLRKFLGPGAGIAGVRG
jgi:predicted metalloprotease with PDZ domain